MSVKSLVMSAMLIAGSAVGAQAQALVDGSQVDEILNAARGYGAASLDTQTNGNPKIEGKIDGITYHVYFMSCDENHANCEDLNFYAGFLDNKQTMEAINNWNRDKRFGKAYLDSDLDAVLEYDVNLEYGVSPKNLDAAFSLWNLVLGQYAIYIGHS